MEAYRELRETLCRAEALQRDDFTFKQQQDDVEAQAHAIVAKLRQKELASIWNGADGGKTHLGMPFAHAQQTIEKTELWRIVRRMPKAALLHAHFSGTLNVRWLVGIAVQRDDMFMQSDRQLTLDSMEAATIRFDVDKLLKEPSIRAAPETIFQDSFVPGSWVPFKAAADYLAASGGQYMTTDEFLDALTAKMMAPINEIETRAQGINCIWSRFESVFFINGGLTDYEPLTRQCFQHMFGKMKDDNVGWMDMRTNFGGGLALANGTHGSSMDYVRIFTEELEKFKAGLSEQDKLRFWGARAIWTVPRGRSTDRVEQDMDECIAAKLKYPETIAGYDLVAQEGLGRTLADHAPSLVKFREKCKANNVSIPFFFHAGEVLGDGDEHDSNLFDAIALGTKRIGHGFSLFKHPVLMEQAKLRKICVEVCPISNEVLRLTHSICAHPLPAMIANGVSCSINSDASGIFGQPDILLSYDFWQVLQGFDNIGLGGLGNACVNSIEHAAFSEHQAEQLRLVTKYKEIWRTAWREFCRQIVSEYGGVLGGTPQ